MTKRTTGEYENVIAGGEEVLAFLPYALPPRDPAFDMSKALSRRLRAADQALVRLDLATEMVPSLDWFLYGFVRKEAVISSQIEGTQATLLDLLSFEAEEVKAPDADVEEVCNYLDALNHVQQELADPSGIPISIRLLNDAHRRLMDGVMDHPYHARLFDKD
ncbi:MULTISPECIES: Fic/DOC family N-terminal domain-containing protein [Sphingobium]|uniref:Fic/DOC family N-terminal domain-containing protein n=1 Tax=Sphingobium TaxID=165695 RepID=UPI00159BF516|nr:Fic/DOC family N-terminal domain-containing protein [Sphingobium sp. 15-1]